MIAADFAAAKIFYVKEKNIMPDFLMKIISFVLGIITSISMSMSSLTAVINKSNFAVASSFDQVVYEDQLVPQKDTDGNWTFYTDRDLKILQFTDVHIGGGVMSLKKDKKALNAVAAMITAEKPDLVILTGDNVYPVPFQAGTINNGIATDMVITLLEKLGVYYTVCFGNHDSELYSDYTREEIANKYANPELKYSIFQKGPENIDGFGNQVIKVKNSKGIVTNAYFVIDSHDYTDGDILGIQWKYDNIHENQIEWYKENVLAIDKANKAIDPDYPMFPSLCFFHIPIEEYDIAWKEYKANGYKDTENVKYFAGGYYEDDEKVCCGVHPENFFETALELGSTKGMFCGHDHINNASIEYKGIRLTYGMSVDYLAYIGIDKKGAQRGCTVITLSKDGELSVSLENYYQDKYVSKYEKEKVSLDR